MSAAAAISITLPTELLTRIQDEASRQHRSLDDFLRRAIECEMDRRSRALSMLQRTQAWGWEQGIRSEEDVERVANGEITLDELRRSRGLA